jgi:hypothetical protein
MTRRDELVDLGILGLSLDHPIRLSNVTARAALTILVQLHIQHVLSNPIHSIPYIIVHARILVFAHPVFGRSYNHGE